MKFFTDWEGPWILNDIAYELCLAIFNNGEFFERISQYDDYLMMSGKGSAGSTLKLIAPFLVAAELKREEIVKISRDLAKFVPQAEEAMRFLCERYEAVVISTSYEDYLKVTSEMLGVRGKIHGTSFDPEKYEIDERWKRWLIEKVDEIASLPEIDPTDPNERTVKYLNDLFKEIEKSPFKRVLEEVKVVNAEEKRRIMESYGERKVVAIGDSISDVEMLRAAREKGLAVSFNGNRYAVREANVIVVSETALSEAMIVDLFLRKGFEAVKNYENSEHELLDEVMGKTEIYFEASEDVIEKSEKMRKRLRGKVGELG